MIIMEEQSTRKIPLRPREIEILHLFARWITEDADIARELGVGKMTAKNLVNQTMRLTACHTRLQLVRYAQLNGYGAGTQEGS